MKNLTWKQKFIEACKQTMEDHAENRHDTLYCKICKATEIDEGDYMMCERCVQPIIGEWDEDHAPCTTHDITLNDSPLRAEMWKILIPELEKVHGRHFTPSGNKSVFKPLFIAAIDEV